MSVIEKMKLNATVSFDVFPSAVLGSGFTRVKVMAILDADTAKHWIDPIAMHINVFPTLPNGTPNDAYGYMYAKIRLQNGKDTCVGLPWIREETIVEHVRGTMVITLEDITIAEQTRAVEALSANGLKATRVEIR